MGAITLQVSFLVRRSVEKRRANGTRPIKMPQRCDVGVLHRERAKESFDTCRVCLDRYLCLRWSDEMRMAQTIALLERASRFEP